MTRRLRRSRRRARRLPGDRAARSSPYTVPAGGGRARRSPCASRSSRDTPAVLDIAAHAYDRRAWSSRTPRRRHRRGPRHRRRPRPPLPRRRVPASWSPTSTASTPSPTELRRGPSASSPTSATEAGNVDLIDAGRGGVRADRPVLRQRRRRRRHRPRRRPRTAWQLVVRRQRQRPPLGGQAPAARLARPRRGLLLLDGVGRRAARPDRLGAVHGDQARRGGVRRVAVDHLRRPGPQGQLPVPAGREHRHAARRRRRRRRRWRRQVVRSAGVVLEPDEVADVVAEAIADERFLILPHPEVARLHAAQGRRPGPLAGRHAQAAGPRPRLTERRARDAVDPARW